MLVYVAHPIDHATEDQGTSITNIAREIISYAEQNLEDIAFYHPASAFTITPNTTPTTQLNTINNTALKAADSVVAIVPAGVKTWGTIDEIRHALCLGKKVVLYTDDPEKLGWAAQYEAEDDLTVIKVKLEKMHLPRMIRFIWEALLAEEQVSSDQKALENKTFPQYIGTTFQRAGEPYRQPIKGHSDDAGFDLYVSRETVIPPNSFVDVPSNTRMLLPEGTWGYLTGRSSTLRTKHLLVNPGVIDRGYTGELYSGVWNMSDTEVTLKEGERIAQLIILPNPSEDMAVVRLMNDEFVHKARQSSRGHNGFGSTGK